METRAFIALIDETERLLWSMPSLMEEIGAVADLIPRAEMPQIKSKLIPDFVAWLRKRDIKVEDVQVPAGELRPTQTEVDPEKVRKILKKGKEKNILISNDNRVLDGHHHWAATWLRGFTAMCDCTRVDLPMRELVKMAHKFPQVRYKSFGETRT